MGKQPKKREPRQLVRLVNTQYVVMTPEEREKAVRAVGALLVFVREEEFVGDSDKPSHGDAERAL